MRATGDRKQENSTAAAPMALTTCIQLLGKRYFSISLVENVGERRSDFVGLRLKRHCIPTFAKQFQGQTSGSDISLKKLGIY